VRYAARLVHLYRAHPFAAKPRSPSAKAASSAAADAFARNFTLCRRADRLDLAQPER
jgi:hypothetical protein